MVAYGIALNYMMYSLSFMQVFWSASVPARWKSPPMVSVSTSPALVLARWKSPNSSPMSSLSPPSPALKSPKLLPLSSLSSPVLLLALVSAWLKSPPMDLVFFLSLESQSVILLVPPLWWLRCWEVLWCGTICTCGLHYCAVAMGLHQPGFG